jgi:hypothetical protein
MRIGVTGATGLVGSALLPFLAAAGHRAEKLARGQTPSEGFDGIVHLAGESILGRWTAAKKRRILESRVEGTRTLCEALGRQRRKPGVLVSASAIGFYGDRGDEVLREESRSGAMFLSEVCRQWEGATKPAIEAGIRVVNLRIGIVLSASGGALAKMLPAFKFGAGGVIGGGRQWMSWIALDDLTGIILRALTTSALVGPVNGVAPQPVTNREFTKTLGLVLRRPTIFPLPAFAARLAFGEMAEELLLASARVEPTRLLATGYKFRYPRLEDALRHALGVTG